MNKTEIILFRDVLTIALSSATGSVRRQTSQV